MLLPISRPFCIAALIVACVAQLRAAEPLLVEQSVKKLILPGESFLVEGRPAFISALYTELTKKRGFAAKPCLLGRSRGGLWVSSWAIAQPDKVAGIAGIYPVFDLRTYPGLAKAAPAYGMTAQELEASLTEYNPIARINVLANAKLSVCIIHGNNDKVVPLKENSAT